MRKGSSKIVSLMLVLTMALTVLASFPTMNVSAAEQKFKTFTVKDGGVFIEAEDTILDKQHARKVSIKGASGKAGVEMLTVNIGHHPLTEPAHIGFQLNFEEAGSYVIWARVCTGTGSDSIVMDAGAGNGSTGTYRGMYIEPLTYNEYKWVQLLPCAGSEGDVVNVRFRSRESGLKIDSFLLASAAGFIPDNKEIKPKIPDPDVLIYEPFPETSFPTPTVTPAPDHPRVLIRPSEIPAIKEKMQHPEMQYVLKEYEALRDTEFDGNLPFRDVANYDARKLAVIEAKAFDYLLTGNEANGRNAIDAAKNYIKTCTYIGFHDSTRNMGHVMFTIAEVYDWCHDLLTDEDKEVMVASCQNLAKMMEVGYPPSMQMEGHGGELQHYRDWLSLAIATYDEYPEIWNHVAGGMLLQTPSKDFYNQSGSHDQGHCYGLTFRYRCEGWGQLLFYHMNDEKVKLFNDDMWKVPYEGIYKTRPDGQIFAWSDDWDQYGHKTTARIDTKYSPSYYFASQFYNDPILYQEYLLLSGGAGFSYAVSSDTPVEKFLINNPDLKPEYRDSLPLTRYFPYPNGMMIARTGWNMGMDSPDTVAVMRIGVHGSGGHTHQTAGSFQIYHKGILAMKSGSVEGYGSNLEGHRKDYYHDSISHNCLLIGSKGNERGIQPHVNLDGHHTIEGEPTYDYSVWVESGHYDQGDILGHEFGPDTQYPEYSYISGDVAKAYYSDNVQEAVRSMIFFPIEDEVDEECEAAFIVFDRVQTKSSKYNKIFQIHMEEEPTLEGNVLTVTRTKNDYNGKMVNQTLLPVDAKYELIGGPGKQFWVNGKNMDQDVGDPTGTWAEVGWGRLEVSPAKVSNVDYFLNVMYTQDADSPKEFEEATLIETEEFAGAKVFNKVAMFNRERERTSDTVSFTIPEGETEYKVSVAGLEEGTWKITAGGKDLGTQVASVDGGIVYFTAPAGDCTLEYVNDNAEKTFTTAPATELEEVITMIVNDNYLYSDVLPVIIDGRTLIPMRALLEELGATVEWDEATATATIIEGYTEIKITEGSKTVYVNGAPKELDVPAMIIDGRFVVPVRFVSETLGGNVSWNERAKIVKVSKTILKSEIHWDFENAIPVMGVTCSGYSGSATPDQLFDGDISAKNWAEDANSRPEGSWVVLDLGTLFELETLKVHFGQGNVRVYDYEIYVSEDGENFTPIVQNGKSDGETNGFEDIDMGGVEARYIKFTCQGNTVNSMANVLEMLPIGTRVR